MADIKVKSLKSFIILRWPTNVYRRAHSQLATATFFIIVATWSMPGRAQSSVFPKQTNTRVEQVASLTGFVRSSAGFGEQPQVINAASDLLAEVLGEAGKHSRAAVGVAELPRGVSVEIAAVFVVTKD